MKKKIQVNPSGITLVDITWGGFYRGSSYFLIGPKKSGKTILALQYVMQSVKEREKCLIFTSVRPKDLMINAASIDFDLQQQMNQNYIVIVRVTPPKNIELAKDPDGYLTEYIKDIKTVVDQYNPDKVVFDELTPFVGFNNIDKLKDVFLSTTEYIEDMGITCLYVLGEPATPAARKIVNSLLAYSTGYITLRKDEEYISKNLPGMMSIIPNVGHVEGQFSAEYYIEPYKGIEINYQPVVTTNSNHNYNDLKQKYTSFSELDLPVKNHISPNIYSLEEFKLILNNQVAYYNSTNQVFTVVSIQLHDAAVKSKMLTINQLQNAVRLSVEKKDKICIIGNKVVVLFTKEDKDIRYFISKVVDNLPNNNPQYVNTISQFISMYSVKVDKETRDANDILENLFTTDISRDDGLSFS